MTSQIGGAEIFEIKPEDGSKPGSKDDDEEIPQLKPSPSPSKIEKYKNMQQNMYGPLIKLVVEIDNIEPLGRAPELDANTKEMVDIITGYIKRIMDALNISFDEKGYQSFMKKMGHKLYTFMKQRGHSKSNSKGKRRNSKGGRVRNTVRGGMLPSSRRMIMDMDRPRAASPAGHQPPPPYEERSSGSSRRNSSSVSWKQHFIMLFLLLSSIFMVYIANVKFHQTFETITRGGSVRDAANIADEIARALQKLESGNFLQYIFHIYSKPQADIELYYTEQLANIVKDIVAHSITNMSEQIKAICGGEDIFQEGALAVGPIDFTKFVNVITNAFVSTLNSGPTTECITNTVKAMTSEQFHKLKIQIELALANILHKKEVISWLLSVASALGVPPVCWYAKWLGRNVKKYTLEAIRKKRGVSAAHERPGNPMEDGEFPPLPAPEGGRRKTRYRFRRVVKRRTRKN
jgi:hypothetical protein